MMNLKQAGATQLTMKGGELTDWAVTLDGEELYILPSTFTVQDTFEVRHIIEKMMDYAHKQGKREMQAKKDLEIEQILTNGTAQLNALIEHNDELAIALEKSVIRNQPDY